MAHNDPDREHRERLFNGVLGAVEKAGSDLPGMASHALYTNRVDQANLPLRKVKRAVRGACEHGELVRVTGPDETMRYVPTDEATIRETIAWLADADKPPREEIAKLNRVLSEADE